MSRHDRKPDAAREAGLRAGRDSADRWAQDALAGHPADVTAEARRILAGLAHGDPAALDLPAPNLNDLDRTTPAADTTATLDVPVPTAESPERHTEATTAYLVGYITGLMQRAGERCRAVLQVLAATDDRTVLPAPTIAASGTDDRDTLEYLHPDRLRVGGIGVFARDWAWIRDAHGRDRVRVAFVGVLVDVVNGWAVFACSRTVAEAIVADQESMREAERARLSAAGLRGAELDTAVDERVCPMRFDGDDIIVDQRATYLEHGDAAIERLRPDENGRYDVMGGAWCWSAVAPGYCDRIVGDLPTPAAQQQYVAFTHVTGMHAPHQLLQITTLQQTRTRDGVAFTAELSLDGEQVATIVNRGGDPTVWTPTGEGLGTATLQRYADACRRYGTPTTVEQVLAALVTEYDLTRRAAAADAAGDTLLRAVDDDGALLDLLTVTAVRPGHGTREALRHLVAARPAHPDATQWEVWGGTAWHHLQHIPLAAPAPRDGVVPETPH
ncbi:hypothetical protein [Actinoplanes subtropicus]|uniref:hypothetical protein n=1 Tax=Actinoplanes subtropicus TaxID=543632 RepID=UPI00068F1B1A|nr:hypothetical protein [Actinoplanes subtropicus]